MMDGGGCGLNGSGGGRGEGQGSGPQRGAITLEDLESFSGDQLSDSGSAEEAEMMMMTTEEEDEEQNRLLAYWQDVARGHRVEVPRGKGSSGAHTWVYFITS